MGGVRRGRGRGTRTGWRGENGACLVGRTTARGGGGAESKRKAFLESQPEKVGGGNLQSDLPTDVEEQWPEPVLEGDAIDDVGGLNVGAVGTEAVDKAGAVETSEAVRTFPTRSELTLLTESSASYEYATQYFVH